MACAARAPLFFDYQLKLPPGLHGGFKQSLYWEISTFKRIPGASLTLITPTKRITFSNPTSAPTLEAIEFADGQATVFIRELNTRVPLSACHSSESAERLWQWLNHYQEWAVAPRIIAPATTHKTAPSPIAAVVHLQDSLRNVRDWIIQSGHKAPPELLGSIERSTALATAFLVATASSQAASPNPKTTTKRTK